ncbi:MAG: hypothetical protein MPI81_02950 [Synechococcus sp. H1_metabat_bins_2.tsv.006]|mgnify:FL=1|nr:hypothetical protein [Synechococcus sp. H1_metabat_bins_2.tsv.006]
MQDIVQELRSIQTLLDLLMQKRLQLPSGRRAQLERTCDQFQQVMGSLAQVQTAGDEEQTLQLRELLSAIEELHLCLEPLEAPCSDLVARLP